MTMMIMLTEEEAAEVRGPSAVDPLAAIDPVPTADGRWMLPLLVLDDPAHAEHHDFLAGLPQEDDPMPATATEEDELPPEGTKKPRRWVGR